MQDVIDNGVLFGRTGVINGCLWVVNWSGKWAVMGSLNSFNGNVNIEILASDLNVDIDQLTPEQIMDSAMEKICKYCKQIGEDENA